MLLKLQTNQPSNNERLRTVGWLFDDGKTLLLEIEIEAKREQEKHKLKWEQRKVKGQENEEK